MNPFVASPSTTITTTTRQPTTTRPRGSILFFERTTTRAPSSGRSETGCRAVGRWRGRPGMDAWCSSNCRRFHCPRGVCTCDSPRWQNKLPFIFCVGRVGNRINEWFEAGQELEGGGRWRLWILLRRRLLLLAPSTIWLIKLKSKFLSLRGSLYA